MILKGNFPHQRDGRSSNPISMAWDTQRCRYRPKLVLLGIQLAESSNEIVMDAHITDVLNLELNETVLIGIGTLEFR